MNILGFIGGSGIYKLEFLTDLKNIKLNLHLVIPQVQLLKVK